MLFKKMSLGLSLSILVGVTGALAPQDASALDIAETPLFMTAAVDPNIVFMLDDSGSMRWGFMPDELVDRVASGRDLGARDCYYSGTVASGNYLNYAGVNDTCALDVKGWKYLVSKHLNALYFNPNVEYPPPRKPDGSLYSDASFTWAPWNGYSASACTSTNGRCIDLNDDYRAIMDPYYYYGRAGTGSDFRNRYGFVISPKAEGGSAFYYTFNDALGCVSDPYQDNCYDYHEVSEEQRQNFANWFSYYRTREMVAKAGVSAAFHEQGDALRVGYGTINQSELARGVRKFIGDDRLDFFQWLNDEAATGSTPLRTALKRVGEYYETQEPWLRNPGDSSSGELSCRQSYTVLMTDGYWDAGSSDNPSVGDFDDDSHSNTLADVARKYWSEDLRENLDNNVPPTPENPATWQHMVTFGVGLGVIGTLDPDEAFTKDPDDSSYWTNPHSSSNSAHKIDDLLHAAVNSHGGFFSAADAQQFSAALAQTIRSIISRAGATFGITTSGAVLLEGNLAFRTEADAADWTGNVIGVADPDTDSESIKWNAKSALLSHSQRRIYTDGAEFKAALMPNDLLEAIDSDLTAARDIVDYTRGDESLQQRFGGDYHNRSTPIGAIVGAQPVIQRQVNFAWGRLSENDGGNEYEEFVDDKADQPPVIYVGSNAGVLHAFNANNGTELFGYVPRGVLGRLKDVADPGIRFRFTVDGSHVVADAYDGDDWKSVLVGSLGAGGKSIFVLDVTNPATFNENDVLWEVTAADLDEPGHLGFTFAEPQVARLEDGTWAVVVGNGYDSESNEARLLVFDLFDGDLIGNIKAGEAGTEASPNGLSTPRVARERSAELWDRWVYAGDLQGNLWRFDLNALSADGSISTPVFSSERPITSQPQTSYPPRGRGFIVSFGTGKYLELSDNIVGESSPDEYFYLLHDVNPWGNPPDFDIDDLTDRSFSGDTTGVLEDVELDAGGGWYVKLEDGARVRSQPRVLQGNVLFSSFKPSVDECQGGGENDTYLLTVRGGMGAFGVSDLENTTAVIRGVQGAPASPSFVVREVTIPGAGSPGAPGEDQKVPQICVVVGEESICLDDLEWGELGKDLRDGRRTNWIQLK